jgi:hypothetical protein
VVDIVRAHINRQDEETLQFELCEAHAQKLEDKGLEFFRHPEIVNLTRNPAILADYHSTKGSRYRFLFRNWWHIAKINRYELLPIEEAEIPTKRIKSRNIVKDRIKRMMDQANMKLLTDEDWYDAVELALKERMIEQIMKS